MAAGSSPGLDLTFLAGRAGGGGFDRQAKVTTHGRHIASAANSGAPLVAFARCLVARATLRKLLVGRFAFTLASRFLRIICRKLGLPRTLTRARQPGLFVTFDVQPRKAGAVVRLFLCDMLLANPADRAAAALAPRHNGCKLFANRLPAIAVELGGAETRSRSIETAACGRCAPTPSSWAHTIQCLSVGRGEFAWTASTKLGGGIRRRATLRRRQRSGVGGCRRHERDLVDGRSVRFHAACAVLWHTITGERGADPAEGLTSALDRLPEYLALAVGALISAVAALWLLLP